MSGSASRSRRPEKPSRSSGSSAAEIGSSIAGEIYPLPLADSSGAALRPLVSPRHVPVYVAAMGPRNLRLTGEMADGWLGNAFIPEAAEVFLGPLREGAERAGRTLADLDLVAPVAVEIPRRRSVRRRRARAGTRTGTRSRSARWARAAAISTTTRSPGWGTETKSVGSPNCGKTGDATKPAQAVPIDLGRLTNLVGTQDGYR